MTKRVTGTLLLIGILMLLLSGCKKSAQEEIHGFEKWSLHNDAYAIYPGGVLISEWYNADHTERRYQLEDETELLHVTVICLLTADEKKPGLVGKEAMSEPAQEIVETYYREQGEIFDTRSLLDQTYEDYCQCQNDQEKFTAHEVSQEVLPAAQNATYVAFLTAMLYPKEEHYTGGKRGFYDCVIFDRETGEFLDVKDLFTVGWDEVQDGLADLCNKEDTTVSKEDILNSMDQAEILIFQDYLEVWFPYGTWERQEFDKGFGLRYDQVADLMHDWAIPAGEEG